MSGVAGAERVKSRQDFAQFLKSYQEVISKFPGFQSIQPSGSYNSNPEKKDFGDIDLVVHIASDKGKALVKKELQAFFTRMPETVIVPFSSVKHAGKRTYNAGELVSVRYHDDTLGYSAQIDNIIALDQTEATFKQQFLDWPAEKQGLILGLVKISTIETPPEKLFQNLNIKAPPRLEQNQEYEFNLSSVELQLRKVTYSPGTFQQTDRELVWRSQNFDDLQKLLYQYNLNTSFDELLKQCQLTIKNPRSKERIKGVFSSMITVKSGEVGTAKGAGKEAALAKINQTLGEQRKSQVRLLNALINPRLTKASTPSTVVFAFGRFQPPTTGHEVLFNKVKEEAAKNNCPYVIYVSKKVGRTPAEKLENPLTVEQKMTYLQKMFPGTHFAPATDTIRTPMEAAVYLNQKYQNLIMVAGGDRASQYETLLNQYNNIDYKFDTINIVKIDRDPDDDTVKGMSGTKLRKYAKEGNYEQFKKGMPPTLDDTSAQQLMADVKLGMTPTPKSTKISSTKPPKAVKQTKPDSETNNIDQLKNLAENHDRVKSMLIERIIKNEFRRT